MKIAFSLSRFVLIILFVYSPILLHAQDSLWTKTFGGTNIDVAYAIMETNDGGYAVAGYTRSYGTASGRNLWIFRTDKHGNLTWNKAFGGNSDDEAAAVKQTQDDGLIHFLKGNRTLKGKLMIL